MPPQRYGMPDRPAATASVADIRRDELAFGLGARDFVGAGAAFRGAAFGGAAFGGAAFGDAASGGSAF